MRKNSWVLYFIYALVLVAYMIFSNNILVYINEQAKRNFDNSSLIICSMIIFITLGLLLGLEKLLLEMRKGGKWRVNLPKLILLGVPSLYFSLGIFVLSIPIAFIRYPILYFLKYDEVLAIFQVILGFVIITSFIKVKE